MDVKQIIKEIEGFENKQRKSISFSEAEIYNDKIYPYVERYLQGFYSKDSVKEMSVYATINLAKRIVDQEASLYREAPVRTFTGLSESQIETVMQVYRDIKMNQTMLRSNRAFKLQGQNHIELLPNKQKLTARVLLNHHVDAIPNDINPELADGFVVSGFDRAQMVNTIDVNNETIGDKSDYKSTLRKYAFWTDQQNFIVDDQGELLSQETENPLNMIPIVEVAGFKDFTYWVDRGTNLTDFTIQFNATMTDIAHIVRMQGFAQAYISGSSDLLPEALIIGPNHIIRLPIDPNNPVPTQFGFASPSPDLAGSLKFPEMLLSAYLSSKGLNPKLITGSGESEKYTSGLDRLLSMIDRFEASKFDMDLYKETEKKLFYLIIRYLNTYAGTNVLNYSWSNANENNVDISIQFKEPQMLMSDAEKIDTIARKKEIGLMSDLDAIKEYYGIDDDMALAKLNEIKGDFEMPEIVAEQGN